MFPSVLTAIGHISRAAHDRIDGLPRKLQDPKWSGGRPTTISDQVRRQICLIARCCPRDLGLAFGTWSLTKLADYLAATGVAVASRERIRQILHDAGVRWAGHQDLEGLHRPRLHYQDAPGAGPL